MAKGMKRSITDRTSIAASLLAGILLAALSVFLQFTGQTVEPKQTVDPIYEMTGTWGDFDEVRLFRYFRLEDIPDLESVPPYDVEYKGETWEYVGSDGPIKIEFGDCWEAMYRKEESR